jgi:hypothetical protein
MLRSWVRLPEHVINLPHNPLGPTGQQPQPSTQFSDSNGCTVTGLLVCAAIHQATSHRTRFPDHANEAKAGMVSLFQKLVFVGNTSKPLEIAAFLGCRANETGPFGHVANRLSWKYVNFAFGNGVGRKAVTSSVIRTAISVTPMSSRQRKRRKITST